MLAGGIALLLAGTALQDSPPPPPATEPPVTTPETSPLPGRRRPGVPQRVLEPPVSQDTPGALRAPPPEAFPTDQIPVPDRWRLIESLGLVKERWFDPYRQNTLKGDRPIHLPWLHGDDWFLNISAVSDTVVEPRTFPIPVG